jgi:hypothetical protein
MVDGRNAETYWDRARQWRLEAENWPPGHQHDACVALVEGYENLVRLIESSGTSTLPSAQEKSGAQPYLPVGLSLALDRNQTAR